MVWISIRLIEAKTMNLSSRSIFRIIRKADEQWVGSGFVFLAEGEATQPVFVTCAHVVADALNDRSLAFETSPPEGSFYIDFPNSHLTSLFEARVYQSDENAWYPLESLQNSTKTIQDLALIDIGRARPPRGIDPVLVDRKTVPVSGDTVYALGGAEKKTSYKENVLRLAEGIVQAPVGTMLQVRAESPLDDAFIEGGFSGGPLWSGNSGQILGIVSIADKKKRLAWVIPSESLFEILEAASAEGAKNVEPPTVDPAPEIPFDFQPRQRELLLKRGGVEGAVDSKIDTAFLMYLFGSPNSGKSSEVLRLLDSPLARLVKERTIWQTCIEGTEFAEMADYIAEDCLGITDGKKFGVRELIRALRGKEMYLVLDGYSADDHPTLTPLIETAAPLEKPTHVVVTSYDSPRSTDVEQCAIEIPIVRREELVASIEALGAVISSENAHLVADENYDANSAFRIVSQLRDGSAKLAPDVDSNSRVEQLIDNDWSEKQRKLIGCISLVESSVQESLFQQIGSIIGLQKLDEFKEHLLAESLIKADDPRSFMIRDFCREKVINRSSDAFKADCHTLLGDAFAELVRGKDISEFSTPSLDILNALRAISHFQSANSKPDIRSSLLRKVKRVASRKGMHRQLSKAIWFEIEKGNCSDPWNYIHLIQYELAQGRIVEAFEVAKLAQKEVFSAKAVDRNLVVSLCTQIASVLIQAGEDSLAGQLLGVSKNLLPSPQITSRGLVPIRDSLKAWCDGRQGKVATARKVGEKLLAQGRTVVGEFGFMQVGVESTRLGILEGNSGDLVRADELLLEAVENFSKSDRRGEIWALSHLCYFRLKGSSTAIPDELLARLFDLQATTLLIGEETYSHYKEFVQALKGHHLYDQAVSLNESFKPLYEKRSLSSYEVEYTEAFMEFLKQEFSGLEDDTASNGLDFLSKERMNNASLNRASYIGSIVQQDPVGTITRMYQEIPTKVLLNSPFYSRILTASLLKLDDQELIDAFIVSFFEDILRGPHHSRLNFAGFFERCNRIDLAIQLLNTLRNENSFRFHNILGNCYRRTNFDKSRFHNEQALLRASSPEEESRIYNNLSALHLIHKGKEGIDAARDNVDLSLETRASHFYWPFRTKLAVDILDNPIEHLEVVVEAFSENQKLSERAIEYVSGLIADPKVKMAFLDVAPRYAS